MDDIVLSQLYKKHNSTDPLAVAKKIENLSTKQIFCGILLEKTKTLIFRPKNWIFGNVLPI
jgi:hypothetical protein